MSDCLTGEPADRDQPDRELAAAVTMGDQAAYDVLYRRHHDAITAVARMILGAGPACEDVVADVFMGFWFLPDQFEPERGTLLSFLRLKARHRSIDVLRSETSRRRREDRLLVAPLTVEPEIETALVAAELSAQLKLAIAALPASEREAVQLAFYEGMTYQAVARHLGVAEGTVKSRIRSGLRRLRSCRSVRLQYEWNEPAAVDGPPPYLPGGMPRT